ncbi:hypothetical protein [Natronoflexus pectinivorans]|nr:hypothetical protein [Natronoflexus pectinivorans]
MAVVNGHPSYTPPARLKKFEEDLESIMIWLGASEDVLLTRNRLSTDFVSWLSDFGFEVPKCMDVDSLQETIFAKELHPWGWSPAIHKFFSTLEIQLQDSWKSNPMNHWKSEYKRLLSRLTGVELIKEAVVIIEKERFSNVLIPHVPVMMDSPEYINHIEKTSTLPLLLKTPWSASGRGLFKIRDKNEQAWKNPWILGKLKQQGFLLGEPFLHKLQDVSFHFWCDSKGVHSLGTTYFSTDKAGRFLGCYTHLPKDSSIPESLMKEGEKEAESVLLTALQKMKINTKYRGPIGVDGLFFLSANGKILLNPCIEVNMRYSMGLINLKIRERLAPGRTGKWQIGYLKAREWDDLAGCFSAKSMHGMITGDILPLSASPKNEGYMAWFEVFN